MLFAIAKRNLFIASFTGFLFAAIANLILGSHKPAQAAEPDLPNWVCSTPHIITGDDEESLKAETPTGSAPKVAIWKKSDATVKDGYLQISVGFLDGSTTLHNEVLKLANAWSAENAPANQGAYVKFVKAKSGHEKMALVRVKFTKDLNNSRLGRYARVVAMGAGQSMNLGVGADGSLKEHGDPAVVMHEFGHVLGMNHELKHPGIKINWNKPVVYSHYWKSGKPTWSGCLTSQGKPVSEKFCQHVVDEQIMSKLTPSKWLIQTSKADLDSIMRYPVASGHMCPGTPGTIAEDANTANSCPSTMLGGFGYVFDISDEDMKFARKLYPKFN